MSNERRHEEEDRRRVRRVFIDAEEVIIRTERVRIEGENNRNEHRHDDRHDDRRRPFSWI
ncbi:hypothetical protein [Bacillus sp. OK048]|uniref:hypothetical protein n=1 Tax=Bacillus sp. OK048 TaxID=1882761 RepID=UPI00088BE953|nr:hypothetical protein [Bacillus sp. OK048]SDM62265.1 hypothetical protein SAMN05443253_104293 [Bacillus sp. OK048]